MNKYVKWSVIVFALLAVLFAVGCAKSVMEDSTSNKVDSVMVSRPAIATQEYVIAESDYDEGYTTGASEPSAPMYKRGYMPPYYDDNHYGDGESVDTTLKIIRTASINLEVDDYFIASTKVEAFAKKYGGYVSTSNARADQNNRKSGTVTIRVPELHFDAVLAELSLLGDIKSKNMGGQDVTEQHIDLQARVNNSQAHEKRLLAMYDNASNMNEMMNVERELSRVRENIERMEGQLRYLNNRVAMSSVTVYLYEPTPVVKKWGVWQSVKNSLNHSLATLRFLIELFGWLLPLGVVALLVLWIVKMLRGKRRRKR
jgi:hypothetical protein